MAIQNSNLPQLKNMLNAPSVKAKFEEMLGKRAPQFLTSITSVVSNNALLQKADASSIVMGAAIAASMDLPLNPNLGYAALVPFNSKDGCFAQFQIMVKGWTDLFLRSGQCQSLINEVVYEGQLVSKNKFTGDYVFDEGAKVSDKIIGVMAYFRLTNGFEKTEYMTIDEVKAHAQKFSQSYRRGAGIWKESFESMALKTVLKRLLVKWAPKSLEMNMLQTFDQSVVKGDIHHLDEAEPQYIDRNVEHADNEDNAYTDVEDVTTETDSAPKDASPVNNTDDNKAKDELEF